MPVKSGRFLRRHRVSWILIVVLAIGIGSAIAWPRNGVSKVPTAEVHLDDFVDYLSLRGEVKAQKSVVLNAPSSAGDIQLLTLLPNGTQVNQGNVVIQFDITNLKQTADQKRSELREAQAEIEQVRAQARLLEEQNLTDLLKAQYGVERAKLEVSKQEILSKIDFEKAKLELADSQQKLREIEEKLKSDRLAADADVESKKQKREKALFEVQQAERTIAAMTLKAPVSGMVTILPNWRAGGFFSDTAPPFKTGDRAWPGAGIAELPDLTTIQVNARIDESERGRLQAGQAAIVKMDALPDRELTARVKEISPLTKPDFSGWPPTKNFDLVLRLDQIDPRLRPGMSASARIAVERLPNAILIPAEAAFENAGETVAYVRRGRKFKEQVIEITRRGSGKLVVSHGLKVGDRVALKDPRTAEEGRPE